MYTLVLFRIKKIALFSPNKLYILSLNQAKNKNIAIYNDAFC